MPVWFICTALLSRQTTVRVLIAITPQTTYTGVAAAVKKRQTLLLSAFERREADWASIRNYRLAFGDEGKFTLSGKGVGFPSKNLQVWLLPDNYTSINKERRNSSLLTMTDHVNGGYPWARV
ncbi:hypothetical protein BaRGS_00000648 [Batillaria attramentaria]|uniref:Uncharacterized protein n=1 Tax=Batillaria attramentaria TaxID=370345 RepID=A0ABD0M9B1_9CAEN